MSDNTDSPQIGGKGQDDSPGLPRLWAEKRASEPINHGRAFGKVAAMWRHATEHAKHGDILRLIAPDGDRYFRYNAENGRWLIEE
jgi:hypothetical protein